MDKTLNLLTRNIRDVTYADVVAFCKQKVLENVQLDYKANIPKELAKHFATFSNTLGGLIIIGVGEGDKGLPTTSSGVPNHGKLIDQIHQIAANVTPLPTYDVCLTDEQACNVFILLYIHEGASTPYTTRNDPTVWIRNGNISTPASREELLRLANKKRDAEAIRSARVTFVEQYFTARVTVDNIERHVAGQIEAMDTYRPRLTEDNSVVFTLTIQPYYPNRQLTTPQELLDHIQDYCGREYYGTVFSNKTPETLPGGITGFSWNKNDGRVCSGQLYADGVSNLTVDVLTTDSQTGKRSIQVFDVAMRLYKHLKITQSYYEKTGYRGLVVGTLSLTGGSGVEVHPIQSGGFSYNGKILLNHYDWSFEIDTPNFYDNAALNQCFSTLIRDFSWSLGISNIPDRVIQDMLKSHGWQA